MYSTFSHIHFILKKLAWYGDEITLVKKAQHCVNRMFEPWHHTKVQII